jgi:(p)ppGpp synthase/HD superfamily hydrolase
MAMLQLVTCQPLVGVDYRIRITGFTAVKPVRCRFRDWRRVPRKQHFCVLRHRQRGALSRFSDELLGLCELRGIECLQFGRIKTFASTTQKMLRRGIGYGNVFDKIGARLVVGEIADCYQILSDICVEYIHFEHLTRDYIACPKANGYQSLHVSILSHDGWRIEVQIRTLQMHKASEHGDAAHSTYKGFHSAPNAK